MIDGLQRFNIHRICTVLVVYINSLEVLWMLKVGGDGDSSDPLKRRVTIHKAALQNYDSAA